MYIKITKENEEQVVIIDYETLIDLIRHGKAEFGKKLIRVE